ncbi:uncharacterized protein EURHEDRAFT_399577 [Aspergillus ruber CBS 135680]|uniref:Uncharacterized protein n=1 Tax=Aspergillus ruber (strain CBS 135680) TaxID=1388766 RepID=A0A017SQQ3_ASPRC|nr:uncharacterized protein EURHEDRAFT_399577 [Aspergillus ruber CBS 135680]EYE99307.1 hypothetical protein EURHEDRAFT_399577 [Aspergillus ruber CBS 135680]
MCEMLMDHGARVDGQSLENYYTSQLYQKVKHGEIGKASLLSILVSATREQSQGRGDGFVQYLLDLDVNHQRGTVGCPPINMIMLIEPTEGVYDYILYTSPLKEAINLQSITLTGMFVEHGTPVTDYEHFPNSFASAINFNTANLLFQRFLNTGLDPRAKVLLSKDTEDSYFYHQHGIIEGYAYESVLEPAAGFGDGLSLATLLRAATWTVTEKGRALAADVNVETTLYGYYTTLSAATPLVLAVEQQDISLIRRLLNAGADSRYPPAFVSAASTENKQIMKIILEAEANISSLSSESCGITAF